MNLSETDKKELSEFAKSGYVEYVYKLLDGLVENSTNHLINYDYSDSDEKELSKLKIRADSYNEFATKFKRELKRLKQTEP